MLSCGGTSQGCVYVRHAHVSAHGDHRLVWPHSAHPLQRVVGTNFSGKQSIIDTYPIIAITYSSGLKIPPASFISCIDSNFAFKPSCVLAGAACSFSSAARTVAADVSTGTLSPVATADSFASTPPHAREHTHTQAAVATQSIQTAMGGRSRSGSGAGTAGQQQWPL